MKKVYFIAIALVVVLMAAVSCTGSPKSRGDSPAPEAPESVSPPPEPADEFPPEEPEIEDDEIAGIDTEDADWEEPEFEETDLAEEEPPAQDELLAEEPLFEEPEPPAAAAAPEPPPPPPPPPPAAPPPATPPPTVTARPTPPPATPRPAAPPPPAATPAPPPAAPPVAVQEPPPREEPPAREPVPRVIPELPNPTPAFRGRQDDEVVFSRTVRATVGQLVMVPFRGTGWVYLGETGSRKGIVYDARRLDPEGQSFIFRTEAAGEYALKFYRQDFIRDFILNDYVQVIVSDPPEAAGTGWFNPSIDRGRVIAEPRWPTSLEEAQARRGDTQPSRAAPAAPTPAAPAPVATERPPAQQPPAQAPPAQTPPAQTPPAQPPRAQAPPAQTPPAQTTPPPQTPPAQPPAALPPVEPVPEPEPPAPILELEPDEYLQKAKEEFDAGRIAAAISYLNKFCEYYPVESDEVLWLYGQFYEANSPSRNILAALDCYRRLTQEYPQSSRYDAARRRIAYLQRYYINIQ